MIGASVAAVGPEDRSDEIQTVLAKVRAGEHIHHLETIRVRKDGTVFPVSLTVSPICGADGAVVGTSMISRNMTALRHAAEYARSLIEVAQDPLMTISPEGTINDVNEATVKATGVPREALIGTDFSQYFTDPEAAHEVYQRAFTQGSVTDYPLTLRHADGTLTDLLCNASVYRDLNGNVLGVSAIGRDVTEQNRAREVAAHLAAIVQSTDDAIISASLDGLITSWNPAAQAMFGYTAAEVLGRPAEFLTPRDRAGEIAAVLEQVQAGRHVERLETKRLRKDGTVFPVSLTVSPIRDGGVLVGTSVIYRDLSEQKHAAQYARSLIEAAMDPLMTISPEGTIYDVNEATVKATGVLRSKLIGTEFCSYFTDPEQAHGCYQRAFTQGSITDYPLTLRHRDGTLTDVLYNASVYRDTGGNVLGVCAAAREVAERK